MTKENLLLFLLYLIENCKDFTLSSKGYISFTLGFESILNISSLRIRNLLFEILLNSKFGSTNSIFPIIYTLLLIISLYKLSLSALISLCTLNCSSSFTGLNLKIYFLTLKGSSGNITPPFKFIYFVC